MQLVQATAHFDTMAANLDSSRGETSISGHFRLLHRKQMQCELSPELVYESEASAF